MLRIVIRKPGPILLLIYFSIITLAGENTTATPVPTKTPTAVATEETPDRENIPDHTLPLTQSALQVLTGNVQRPNGITWFEDKLYAACNGDWTIYEIDEVSGATRTYIYGPRNQHTLLIEPNEVGSIDIWTPDYDTNTLLKVNQARAPQNIATNLEGPWGIARESDSSFLITNLIGNNVVRVTESGETSVLIEGLRSPAGIAIADNYVYIANNGSARRSIEWINKSELDDSDDLSILVSGLQNTTGVVIGPDGLLYFSYALGTRGVVGRVDPEVCRENGGCTNDQVEVVVYSELAAPLAGLTITPDMRLFIHTIYRPEIYWVQLDDIEQDE